jgi:hypothetical protein
MGASQKWDPVQSSSSAQETRHATVAVLGLKTTRPVRALGPCAVVPVHTHPPSIDTKF